MFEEQKSFFMSNDKYNYIKVPNEHLLDRASVPSMQLKISRSHLKSHILRGMFLNAYFVKSYVLPGVPKRTPGV